MQLRKVVKTLTDGSKAYTSQFFQEGGFSSYMTLPCITEKDADELMDKLKQAVETHTNETVTVYDFT